MPVTHEVVAAVILEAPRPAITEATVHDISPY
jgi:hypothetical protein